MKKILLTILSAFVLCGCANVTEGSANKDLILPLFSTNSQNQDKMWVGTFQIVFNDMKNNILKKQYGIDNVYFANEKPTEELIGLNKEEFNSSMLNESSYYTSYGETSPEAKEGIKKGIKEKFNETSDILDLADWTKRKGSYYAYAMLKKQFEFLSEFDIFEKEAFNNSSEKYQYFGIKGSSDEQLHRNVNVLFYNNKDNYAVALNTKNGDIVYLYRTDENNSLKNLYEKMLDERKKYKGMRRFNDIDTLKIPNMKFSQERKYTELCNKTIKGTNSHFSQAIETLQFELDNKGGKVKSKH